MTTAARNVICSQRRSRTSANNRRRSLADCDLDFGGCGVVDRGPGSDRRGRADRMDGFVYKAAAGEAVAACVREALSSK